MRTRNLSASLAAGLLLATALSVAKAQDVSRDSRAPVRRESDSGAPLVIQGRITSIAGALVTVKTPDGYPGGPGGHPEFVLAGSTFKADVSRARVLLPDGRRADTQPLAVGDRVLIVLSSSDSGSPAPNSSVNIKRIYTASIVERLVVGDKVITH